MYSYEVSNTKKLVWLRYVNKTSLSCFSVFADHMYYTIRDTAHYYTVCIKLYFVSHLCTCAYMYIQHYCFVSSYMYKIRSNKNTSINDFEDT